MSQRRARNFTVTVFTVIIHSTLNVASVLNVDEKGVNQLEMTQMRKSWQIMMEMGGSILQTMTQSEKNEVPRFGEEHPIHQLVIFTCY